MTTIAVKEIIGNELVTPDGSCYFHEIISKDLEHSYQFEKEEVFRGVVNSLNTLKSKNRGAISKANESNATNFFYKVYHLDGKCFVCTDDPDFEMSGWSHRQSSNPFVEIVGNEDIYSEPVFDKDFFVINGQYWRFVNLYNMVGQINFNEALLYGDFFLTFRKYPLSQAKSIASKSRRSHSANMGGSLNRNIESEKSLDETERIYNELLDGTENLFDMQFWYVIRARTKDELEDETLRVLGFIKRKDGDPLIETHSNQTILQMYVPGPFVNFKRTHLTISSHLACFVPFASEMVHKTGTTFYSTEFNPVKVGFFNETALNFNGLITGKSGSGKSVLAQKIVLDLLNENCSAVILDKGKSFEKIAKYMNGNIFSEKFNPMQFRNPTYLKAFVLSVIPDSEMTVRDRGRMFELIEKYLSLKEQGTFKDLVFYLEQSFKDISSYFSEFWSYITDDFIEIRNITYVDTALYPKSIIGPLIIYLIEYFKNVQGRKIFVFDECWEYLANNADYIEECFRTFRKHDASALAITQDIRDFLMTNSKVGQVVFNNTTHKFFFMQETIQDGHLNEEDAEIIRSLRTKHGLYSEFFYKDDNCRKVLRYPMTKLEHELFTTKREHVLAFNKFHFKFEEYFSFPEIMEKWVDFKYSGRIPVELL